MRDDEKSKEQLLGELRIMRRLVELSPDAVFIQSDQKLVYANAAGAQLLGAINAEELIGQQIIDVVSPTRWQNVQELVQDLLEERRVPRIEKKFVRLDGSSVDVEVAAIPFTYHNKPAMQLVAHDITRRKRAEEALRESEERFRQLVDNAPLGFMVFEPSGKVTTTNPSMVQILGFPSEDAVKGVNGLTYPPLVEAGVSNSIRKCLETGETTFTEHLYKTSWGDTVWLHFCLTPIRVSGRTIGVQALVEDFTERKQAEDALRVSEDQYRDLFENANDIIQSVNSEGRFIYVNRIWHDVLGYTEDDLKKMCFTDIVHPDSLSNCVELMKRVMDGEQVNGLEAVFLTKDGRLIEVEGNLSCRWEDGKHVATRGIFRDITERKRAQEELLAKDRRIRRELQLANTIQSSLFPVNLPQVTGATLAATAVSANEVGGDYCDLFITKDKKLGIAIGDVMGKGVPAALFVAMTYAFVRNYAISADQPSPVVNRVNRSLYPQLDFAEQFITFFYGIYDPATRELLYTNAGHNPPIVYRAATGECEELKLRDFFLGGRQDAQYRETKAQLDPGDVVLFYTDGLKEGRNKDKEQFGMQRITNLLKESAVYDPASIQELISYEFNDFLAGEPPYDDVTMIVIKIDPV